MTHIAYKHSPNLSIVGAMISWIRHTLPVKLLDPPIGATGRVWPRRCLITLGWLVALVSQFGMLWLLREVIAVAHGLMELWLQLANQQLDLVSLYDAVREK